MAFWKSDKDDKTEEMEEVKRRVEGQKTKLPEPPQPPSPEEGEPKEEEDMPAVEEEPAPVEEPTTAMTTTREPEPEARPEKEEGEGDFAPLFVKIDKYRQVLRNLEEIKNSLQDLRDLFELMQQVDQIKGEGMKELRKGISGLAETLIEMDEKFIRPTGAEEIMEEEPTSEVAETVRDLQNQLKNVSQELDRME